MKFPEAAPVVVVPWWPDMVLRGRSSSDTETGVKGGKESLAWRMVNKISAALFGILANGSDVPSMFHP